MLVRKIPRLEKKETIKRLEVTVPGVHTGLGTLLICTRQIGKLHDSRALGRMLKGHP